MGTADDALRASTGADGIHARLRSGIASGRYGAGHRFVESSLAEELEVSRTPVREAIQRLQSEGLVARDGRGARVVSVGPEEVLETYDVRAALEALTARRAAERQRDGHVPPAAIDELRAAGAAFDEGGESVAPAELVAVNLRIHQSVAEISGHRFAAAILRDAWTRLAISSALNLSVLAWLSDARAQHRALIEAIAAGQPEEAERTAIDHVHAAAEIYRTALTDQETHEGEHRFA